MINQSTYKIYCDEQPIQDASRTYSFSYGSNKMNVTNQIARKASQARDCYWHAKEYGLSFSRPLKLAMKNFQIIDDWSRVSTLFANLSDYDRKKVSEDYQDFKKYNAFLLDFLNNQAKTMREAA